VADDIQYTISYGKLAIPVYRAYATPLAGLPALPESTFTGRPNVLLALEIDVEVFGDTFLEAYTIGDNRQVVATDSMKNAVLRETLAYRGATIEGLLAELGRTLLQTYPQMGWLRLGGREIPFPGVPLSADGVPIHNELLFRRAHDERAVTELELRRVGGGIALTALRSGLVGLELLKISGSAFTGFVRDGYTTLPERRDRPLYIATDLHWTYRDPQDGVAADVSRYIAAEQVRDVVAHVFHGFVSESIQHLLHEMGLRLLERLPQLHSIAFAAQNRTRDPVAESPDDPRVRVATDPFNAFGAIRLTMTRGGA